jgi:hypothetical protein
MPAPARLAALVTSVLIVALAPAAFAQSPWLDRTHPTVLRLELARPSFEDERSDFPTFAGFLAARLPLGKKGTSFVAELAMAHDASGSNVTMGNPYLGIDTHRRDGSGGWMEAGLRLPLAIYDGQVTETGMGADLDRWEAFAPEAITFRVAAHWSREPQAGTGFDLRFAPSLWIPEAFEGEPEVFVVYGGQVRTRSEGARTGVGLAGRWLLSGDGGFDDSAVHEVEAAANFLGGPLRPGVTLRLPLDDGRSLLGESLNLVIGVTLDYVP